MKILATLALLPLLAAAPQEAPADAAVPTVSASVSDGCVLAHSTDEWTLTLVPGVDHLVTIRGDGDTDLDFYLYDSFGRLVAFDADYTDIAFLRVPASWQTEYTLRIVNRGGVFNCYSIVLH